MNPFIVIILIQLNFHKFFPIKINGDIVIFFKRSYEVIQIIFVDVFDAEVVDHQDKLDWFCVVLPQARYSLALEISLLIQTLFELVLSEGASLW